jgi:large subunit ribosomal protein L13Ae
MLPHKQPHGAAALGRLQVFEGVPTQYEKTKRLVIPSAVRAVCLKSHRAYCVLGDMASRIGWKHAELVKRLEDRRRIRSAAFYEKKIASREELKLKKQAAFKKLSKEDQEILLQSGKN